MIRKNIGKLILIFIIVINSILQLFHMPVSKSYAAANYTGTDLVAQTLTHIGAGYSNTNRYGPDTFDCSGLVYAAINEMTGSTSGVPTTTAVWKNIIDSSAIGTIITIGGIQYKLVAKNVTMMNNPEYFEKPGTIMIWYDGKYASPGHAAVSLGKFAWQGSRVKTIDYVINQLVAQYGSHSAILKKFGSTEAFRAKLLSDYKTGQPITFAGKEYEADYNCIWKVDALSEEKGVPVNNLHYSKNAADTVLIGVWEPVEVTTPELVSITLIKRIKAEDIVWENGNPTFLFKLSGTDVQNNTHTYYKSLVFTKSYVDSHIDSTGYVSMNVIFSDIITGTYIASEENVARYQFESISSVINGVVNGQTVIFDLENHDTATATFTNHKYEWGGFSHNSCVVNEIK